jgi:acyl-coenzyme A synthetase/AMP-(fatty) acid ligase
LSAIGRPLPGMAITLRDEQGRPTPVGTVGEICVSGAGVSAGYLGDSAATAKAFRDLDWGPNDRRRTYFSGDLGRDNGDGDLEYIGRRDSQVKVRGYRIELGEVSAAIKSHPETVDAFVSTDTGTSVGSRLVGWVVWRRKPTDERELRLFLSAKLPSHMIPAETHAVERLPLTPNGKVDRRALLNSVRAQAPSARESACAGASLEDAVAAIWVETLGVPVVRADDDFFALGGDSFLALTVVARTSAAIGTEVRVLELFAAPRFADFVTRVRCAAP